MKNTYKVLIEEHLDYLYEREIHEVDEEELNFPEDNFEGW